MAFVIVGSLVTACLLLLQGIHIARHGNMRVFFERSDDPHGSHSNLKPPARFAAVALYVIPSLAIFCVLVLALFKNDTHQLFGWLTDHLVAMVGGLFLLTYGLIALLRPDVVIRWVGSAYPNYDLGGRTVQHFVRGLGLFLAAFGLFILKSL